MKKTVYMCVCDGCPKEIKSDRDGVTLAGSLYGGGEATGKALVEVDKFNVTLCWECLARRVPMLRQVYERVEVRYEDRCEARTRTGPSGPLPPPEFVPAYVRKVANLCGVRR